MTRLESPYRFLIPSVGALPWPTSPGQQSSLASSPELESQTSRCCELDDATRACPFHIGTCNGCDQRPETLPNSNRGSSSLFPGIFLGSSALPQDLSMAPCSTVGERAASKTQLIEKVVELFFPAGASSLELDFMYSQFLTREALQIKNEAVQLAVEALGLVLQGIMHNDGGLRKEARERYQAALVVLDHAMQSPSAMNDDGNIGALYLLGFCEMFRPIAQGQARRSHVALQDHLCRRAPQEEYSKYAQLLIYNFRNLSALSGFVERKQVHLLRSEWKKRSAITDSLTTAFIDFLVAVPAVLEEADLMVHRQLQDMTELFDVLVHLVSLEERMHSWLIEWYCSFKFQPYRQSPLDHFVHFQDFCEITTAAFPKALLFPSFNVASLQTTYWIALLQVRQAIWSINGCDEQMPLDKSSDQLAAEANECADRLCQSVAWSCQEQFGHCGKFHATSMLHFASRWYACDVGPKNLEKMAWCDKVSLSIRGKAEVENIVTFGCWSR